MFGFRALGGLGFGGFEVLWVTWAMYGNLGKMDNQMEKKMVSCGFGGFASLDYYYALEPRP